LGDASAAERARFGLEAPRYRVTFLAGGQRSGFSIGGPASDGSGAYLKARDSGAVYVVGKDLLEALDHAPQDFHDKNLHEGVTFYTLDRLTLSTAGSAERRIARRDGFVWLEQPYTALAGTAELSALMNALDGLRAARYVGETASPTFGLATPRFSLTLESLVFDRASKDRDKGKNKRTRERLELRFGSACPDHPDESYVQLNGGTVYCTADAEQKKLDVSADLLRETRVLPLEDSAITGATLSDGVRELTLQTKEQATRVRVTEHGRELQSGEADMSALSEWYAALRGLKIESFAALDANQRGQLEKSGLTAAFARGKDEPSYTMRISQPDAAIATRLNEAALLALPESARSLFAISAARFRKKRVVDEDESRFSALSLTTGAGGSERIVKDKQGYAPAASAAGTVDRARVDELLRLVSKLDAVSFVADAPLPEHGLATPYRTLHVEYTVDKGKTRAHTLVLGAPSGPAGRFAKLDTDPSVFVVANSLASKLDSALVERPAAASATKPQ
jgi:hypothetical protein